MTNPTISKRSYSQPRTPQARAQYSHPRYTKEIISSAVSQKLLHNRDSKGACSCQRFNWERNMIIPLNEGVVANIPRFCFLRFLKRWWPLSDHACHLETLLLGNIFEVSCRDCLRS